MCNKRNNPYVINGYQKPCQVGASTHPVQTVDRPVQNQNIHNIHVYICVCRLNDEHRKGLISFADAQADLYMCCSYMV